MTQTFMLRLPNNLAVKFVLAGPGFEITWSRRLLKKDIQNLEEYYAPWRDNILKGWSIENGKPVEFIDFPLIELMTRGKR